MKKFLKVVLILILLAGAVGATCYFFFSDLRKTQNIYESVNSFIYDANQTDFAADLSYVKNNAGDRFNELVTINKNLKDTAICLNSYLSDVKNKEIDQKGLSSSLKKLQTKQTNITSKIVEYRQKCTSDGFNKVTGANVLFNDYVDYFSSYSNLLLDMRENAVKVIGNAGADVKFSVIHVYLKVVLCDLTETETTANVVKLKNSANITLMNQHYSLVNGDLAVGQNVDRFGIVSNNFTAKYNLCDKTKFAQNLSTYVTSVTELTTSLNKEQTAVFYFKELLGL